MSDVRDEAVAAVGTSRRRGRPREFDVNQHLSVPRDLHRRVAAFAEANEISNARAYRRLVEIALQELERAR